MSHQPHRRKRHHLRIRRRTKPGATPGTVSSTPDAAQPRVHVLAYGPGNLVEEEVHSLDRLRDVVNAHSVTWINVTGIGDAATIKHLGEIFGLHDLALEDVVNVHQRPKVEAYSDYLFIVGRIVTQSEHVETEQISMFLGANLVLTFQERPGDCFDPVRERLRQASGRIRDVGADYLAYALMDAAIDSYFPIIDQFADRLDALEDSITLHADSSAIVQLHAIRNDFLVLRRTVRPHREALNELVRDENPLIAAETRLFLRDCYDHTIQLMDLLEVYRETCGDLRDYYLSLVSNRMNQIMKVLTIIATIFMPLSFIAGVYGMNFDTTSPWNMPELHWRFGYPFALGVMFGTAVFLLLVIWKKGWLDIPLPDDDSRNHDS